MEALARALADKRRRQRLVLWVSASAAAAGAAYLIYQQIARHEHPLELDPDPAPLQDPVLRPALAQGGEESRVIGEEESAAESDVCGAEAELRLEVEKGARTYQQIGCDEHPLELDIDPASLQDPVLHPPLSRGGEEGRVIGEKQLVVESGGCGAEVELRLRECFCLWKKLYLQNCVVLQLCILEERQYRSNEGRRYRSNETRWENWVQIRVRVYKVDLSAHTGLLELPKELRYLTKMRELTVVSTAIMTLPEWLGELCKLEVLRVRGTDSGLCGGCPLQVLPESLGALTGLKTLDLMYCDTLTALPESLGALTGLEDLELSGCTHLKVPALVIGLHKLTYPFKDLCLRVMSGDSEESMSCPIRGDKVDLSAYKRLLELPEALRGLITMRELTVASTVLKTLPEWLGELHGLEVLCVGDKEFGAKEDFRVDVLDVSQSCSLRALPESLGALTGLTTLDLSFCKALTVLPASLEALTGLTTLNLQHCQALTALPAWLGLLPVLTTLNLQHCQALTALPASLGLLTVQTTLNLEHCHALTALPASIGALTALTMLNLRSCCALTALPESLGSLRGLTMLLISHCRALTALPESLGALTGLTELDLTNCGAIQALPTLLGLLTGLKTLDMHHCAALTALPASLGAIKGLTTLNLLLCTALTALPLSLGALTGLRMTLGHNNALHTPPPAVVRAGTAAVLQFLRDLTKGSAMCHLVKVVLLGDQRAGKSSLADSLVQGRPATRADNDRTVGIEVRRWRLGGRSDLIANIYDAAGQRVYRATHGFFMSAGALFLHVVRCDLSEDAAVAALLEWVEAVQQEAPGAVMALVWTHSDWFTDGVCSGAGGQPGFLRMTGSTGGETAAWIAMRYLQQLSGVPCTPTDVCIVHCGHCFEMKMRRREEDCGSVIVQQRVETWGEDVRGKVALVKSTHNNIVVRSDIQDILPDLQSRGAVGIVVILNDFVYMNYAMVILGELSSSLGPAASIPIMLISERDAGALALPGAKLTAFPDIKSKKTSAMQARVLEHVHTKIEQQVRAVDKALRQLEDAFMPDLDALQHTELSGAWVQAREHRDESLAVLDQVSLVPLLARRDENVLDINDIDLKRDDGNKFDSYPVNHGNKIIIDMVNALAKLNTQHSDMAEMEEQMAAAMPGRDLATLVGQLHKLRQQRVQRPRILCSHSVSNHTGQGLHALKFALAGLVEDTRLFAHVGANVPLNYCMLERLAHEGREGVVEHGGTEVIRADWELAVTKHVAARATVGLRALCRQPFAKTADLEKEAVRIGLGLEWRCTGIVKPTVGRQLTNIALGKDLSTKLDFTSEEWAAFGITDLQIDDFIKLELHGVSSYFKPVVIGMDKEELHSALRFLHSTGSVLHYATYCTGLKWRCSGIIEPTVGRQLTNLALANELLTKLEFTKEEWALFGIVDLHIDDYIQSELDGVSSYFKLGVIGMNKEELNRENSSGVLEYGPDTRRSSHALQGTVFMQPQFIIDAIKYVIREPNSAAVNDEIRALDTRIQQDPDNAEALARFLGTHEAHGSGVLTRQLLRHLWRHLNPQHHRVLLELMKVFSLLRPLADKDTFLVPAMLPRRALPDEYITPDWWCPSQATAVADMEVQDVVRRAEMRIMYKVLGGQLPFGFMSELQVRLAQNECVDQDEELHFAPEASVVDRISGSVLSVAYKCGGGIVQEWVILSQANVGEVVAGEASNSLRVMGWAQVSSQHGATDWRLFKRVVQAIEGMAQSAPGLNLRKMAFYVDANGKLAKPLEITQLSAAREIFSFAIESGGKINVWHDLVLPSHSETKLSRPQQPEQQATAADRALQCVEAFFAKTTDDRVIDVHGEGQMMRRIIGNPGCGWKCLLNPQPTIEDLYSCIGLAKQSNMRVLHLAGHGRKECGFIWNASDSAITQREFDVDSMSLAIGSVAGQNGPMECAVLNACSTEKMGKLLLMRGVPYVICWRTPVQDETAKVLCDFFYRALVENASGARDYKRAFFAATDAMRLSAHTGGSAHMPRGSKDVATSYSVLHSSSNTTSVSPYVGESSRGKVLPWHQEDVVLFLSKDGDSEPIYLWRERLAQVTPPAYSVSDLASAEQSAAEEPIDAALKALFEKSELSAQLCVDVCRELGVKKVGDLAEIESSMLDALPNYLQNQLKPLLKKRLLSLIGLQPPAARALTSELRAPLPAAAEVSPAAPRQNQSVQVSAGRFTVSLSKACAGDLSVDVQEILLQEFASWSPGPVLFAQDDQVKLVLERVKYDAIDVFEKYRNRIGTVVRHSIDTPQLVQVRLDEADGSPSENLDVLCSSLKSTTPDHSSAARTKRMVAEVQALESSLDPSLASDATESSISTVIGYSEFRSQRQLEREYWIALSPLTCALGEIASGEPDHNLVVMHVKYEASSSVADPSNALRASLRHTRSVVRRAHQDKCRACEECAHRAACDKCLMSNNAFARHESCGACQNCDHCTEFKWAKTYGVLSPPLPRTPGLPLEDLRRILGKCESKCDPSRMFMSSLHDFSNRRFAFVLGNDKYTHVNPLANCISGAKQITEQIRKLSFKIYKDRVLENQTKQEIEREFVAWACMLPRDAVAFIYIAAHGRELDGDQFLIPVDFAFEGDDIVSNVKAACVSLSWMRERLNHVLRQTGLILLFWDCCRENDKKHAEKQKIVRGDSRYEMLAEEFEKCSQDRQALSKEAELHGGHCQVWKQSWAELHARVSRLDYTKHAPTCRDKAPVAIDSLITGVKDLKTQIQQFSPPGWPGCIEVFAAMHASLALDGGQGAAAQDAAARDTSPLVHAMRWWFEDRQLVQCHVHDSVVIKHLTERVQHFSDRRQRAEWRISGNTDFRFRERDSNDMELD